MDSFFFNITHSSYKVTELYRKEEEYITRVDISNGIVFFHLFLKEHKKRIFTIKNFDRMVVIPVIKEGSFSLYDHVSNSKYTDKANDISLYCSSRQNMELHIKKSQKTEIFVLFIADFFLKRYLSASHREPIDILYEKVQGEVSLEHINQLPLDALSLYLIDKIIYTKSNQKMNSLRLEHMVVEFMLHRFALMHTYDKALSAEALEIAKKAKAHLLIHFANPPSIHELAHLCATNESKIKKVFKEVYESTIYGYIQKLRLEEANLLLREQLLNIGEISKKVGYKHQGYFSKLFFETYGVYPKELLKR